MSECNDDGSRNVMLLSQLLILSHLSMFRFGFKRIDIPYVSRSTNVRSYVSLTIRNPT